MAFLFYGGDHLPSNMGIISGPGSFAVQFGYHLRCRAVQNTDLKQAYGKILTGPLDSWTTGLLDYFLHYFLDYFLDDFLDDFLVFFFVSQCLTSGLSYNSLFEVRLVFQIK